MLILLQSTLSSTEDKHIHPAMLMHNLLLLSVFNYSNFRITALLLISYVVASVFIGRQVMSDIKDVNQLAFITAIGFEGIAVILWINHCYDTELDKKIYFSNGSMKVREYLKLKSILNILVPALVRDKVQSGKKNFCEEEGQVTICFVDIHQFDKIVSNYPGNELIELMDKIYGVFDQLCDQYGLQKIETVGKTYMACGGLKQAEKKVDQKLLNRHHTVRVTDYTMEMLNVAKTIYLKDGTTVEVKIGVHTGKVLSGVVGDTKP